MAEHTRNEPYHLDQPLLQQYDAALTEMGIDPTNDSLQLYSYLQKDPENKWIDTVLKRDAHMALPEEQRDKMDARDSSLPPPPGGLDRNIKRLDYVEMDILDVKCLQTLSTYYKRNAVFKIEWQGMVYTLKVYHQDDVDQPLTGLERFREEQEHRAYVNFKAAGLYQPESAAKWPVLYPYGAVQIPAPRDWKWRKMKVAEGCKENPYETWLKAFAQERGPLDAMLLEWIDGTALDRTTLTVAQGRGVLRALQGVHYARVAHRDIGYRNFLIATSGRVVVVDFEEAMVWPDELYMVSPQVMRSDVMMALVAFYRRDRERYYDSDPEIDEDDV